MHPERGRGKIGMSGTRGHCERPESLSTRCRFPRMESVQTPSHVGHVQAHGQVGTRGPHMLAWKNFQWWGQEKLKSGGGGLAGGCAGLK